MHVWVRMQMPLTIYSDSQLALIRASFLPPLMTAITMYLVAAKT